MEMIRFIFAAIFLLSGVVIMGAAVFGMYRIKQNAHCSNF